MKKRLRFWLHELLRCKHKRGFEYESVGGKMCPYDDSSGGTGRCSLPVYEVYCRDCGMHWTLGEDELIDFFARQKPGVPL
ncbi:MAG: hypothetical protein ABSG90_13470 [Dehalococcoidia bacterium]|jgi:hypothetical protein